MFHRFFEMSFESIESLQGIFKIKRLITSRYTYMIVFEVIDMNQTVMRPSIFFFLRNLARQIRRMWRGQFTCRNTKLVALKNNTIIEKKNAIKSAMWNPQQSTPLQYTRVHGQQLNLSCLQVDTPKKCSWPSIDQYISNLVDYKQSNMEGKQQFSINEDKGRCTAIMHQNLPNQTKK